MIWLIIIAFVFFLCVMHFNWMLNALRDEIGTLTEKVDKLLETKQ